MNAQTTVTPSIVAALAKALPELEGAKKNRANPAFKSKYADLGAVIDAIEPIRAHGLWYRQQSHDTADGVCVETFYIHESGTELSAGSLFMPATKKDAQGFGSALTYARRYALQLAFGLATEDDDGNAASRGQERSGTNREVSPAPVINDSQWAEIVQLVEATGTDAGKLCNAYSIHSLKDMTAEQFTDAKAILSKRLKEKADA